MAGRRELCRSRDTRQRITVLRIKTSNKRREALTTGRGEIGKVASVRQENRKAVSCLVPRSIQFRCRSGFTSGRRYTKNRAGVGQHTREKDDTLGVPRTKVSVSQGRRQIADHLSRPAGGRNFLQLILNGKSDVLTVP